MQRWKFFAFAAVAAVAFTGAAVTQPPGGPPPGGGLEKILDDLKLSSQQQDQASEILKKHRDALRKFHEQAQQDLLTQLKGVLTKEQYQQFKDDLEFLPLPGDPKGPGKGPKGPKGPKDGKGPKGPKGRPEGVAVSDLVDHVLSFDKNKTGKVTKDDLPERMHYLFEMGDTNNDGALDRAELEALAERLSKQVAPPKGKGKGPKGGG